MLTTMVAGSQNIKKQLEILIIDYFRSAYTDFPKGKLKASESPDFVLDISPKNKIGIELTRLYFDDFYTGKNELSDEVRKEIVISARELFELSSSLKLFVKVSFSKERNVILEKQLALPVIVANAVKETVKTQKAGSFFSIRQTTNLPDEIDGIFMATHPVLTESVWEVADFSKKNYETVLKIRQLIAKKEEKLQLYQKKRLNQYWLIITTDRLNNKQKETFHHLIFNTGNSHQFQKIFLFDLLKAQIIQIL
jgi:hypothetical protein